MTNKQIIIDGIDVGRCIYYEDGKCLNGEMVQCNCKKVAVCYYKEYKRKEQECEELKGIRDRNFLHALEEQKRADKLKQTLTEIKEIAESCGWNFGSEILYKRIEHILQKISKCEGNDEN